MTDETPDETPERRPLFRPPAEQEIEKELEFHMAMRARDLIARGYSPSEAQRIAVSALGDMAGVMDECRTISHQRERQMNRSRVLDEIMQDTAFAWRVLRRRPAFASLAVLTIALGIGAATSIFSVVDGVLLRALPFHDPNQLVAVWIAQPALRNDPVIARLSSRTVLGLQEYTALRESATALQSVALWNSGSSMLTGPTSTEQVSLVQATSSLLDVLGEHVALGRGFLPDENVLNGPKVALLSWENWTSRYGGDSSVLGRRVTLDDDLYTIVGVLPRGLRLDRAAPPAAFWTPALQSKYDQPSYHNRSFFAVGRLKPNATAAVAEAQAARVFRRSDGDTTLAARVVNWQYDQTESARGPLYMLLAASGLLLAIACVNVAMLMLSESSSREREFAARVAIGASRARIVRQLLAESMTLALAGAALGAQVAWGFTQTLIAMAPAHIPGIDTASVDLRALLFATVCAALAGIFFGLTPAFSVTRQTGATLVRSGAGQSARHGRQLQQWFVATETAMAFVLLFGAGLLVHSLDRLASVDPGFRPSDVIVVRVTEPNQFGRDNARRLAYYEEGARRLAALPGVEAATAGANPPFAGGSSSSPVEVEGRVYDHTRGPSTEQRSVLPGYFSLLGIPVRAGRTFTDGDVAGSEPVAVISAAAAARDFPGEQAVGKRVRYQGQYRRIIGVVGDVRATRLTRDAGPAIYTPLRQYGYGNLGFVLRTRADLASLGPAIRSTMAAVEPTVAVSSMTRMPTLVARSYADERYRTLIVTAFAVLAAILASVGLYGVTLRAAARRTREIGIRVALGATPARAARLLMTDTLRGVVLGLAFGVPLASLAARRVAGYLFQVAATDLVSLVMVIALLASVAFVASGVPALRAARRSPANALRTEQS